MRDFIHMYFWQIETEIPVATNQSPFAASEAFPPFSGHGACMPPPPTQNPHAVEIQTQI